MRWSFPLNAALLAAGLFAMSCGGSSSHQNQTITSSGANVQAVTVNGGPENDYANGIFTSVTVCVPGSSNCQTIDNVLVDTGSYGLRLLSSNGGGALTLSLPSQTGPNGNPVGECAEFVSAFTWGRVVTADVKMASEQASSMPLQIIDPTFAQVPTSCGAGTPEQDTLQQLGSNGILGIGPFIQDCGTACAASGAGNPGFYYECASNSCQVLTESLTQQVQNPVASFTTDNNGVIVELPSISSPAPSATGSLIFGIGTETNNSLGSAKVYSMNSNAEFNTSLDGQSYGAFLDSGSNAFFFPDPASPNSITVCPGGGSSFYCPSSTANLSATLSSPGGASSQISFSVGNADNLFATGTNFVFPTLGGPNSSSGGFDWGLPFFYGRNVYTAIESRSTPGGQGPYWAF